MQYIIFCLLLTLTLVYSQGAVVVTAVANANTFNITAFGYAQVPTDNAIALVGARVDVDLIKNTSAEAKAEAVAFTFASPRNEVPNGDVNFYFGYFQAKGSVNLNTQTISYSASLLELFAQFTTIFVYSDRNAQAGFQYKLGDNVDCTGLFAAPAGSDCWDTQGTIRLKDLQWGAMTRDTANCPPNYSPNCTVYIYTLSTNGTDNGVATFRFKLASQPVYVDNVLITPDYGKVDVLINYPWASKPSITVTSPKVGIFGVAAGKTTSVFGSITQIAGKPSVLFQAGGRVGSFSWEETAIVTVNKKRAATRVYASAVTGDEIDAYPCPATGCTNLLVAFAKIQVGVMKAFGWRMSFLLFSWADVRPTTVDWDPQIGLSSNVTTNSPIDSGVGNLPGQQSWTVVLLFVLFFWNKLF